MRDRPAGVSDADVRAALAAGWGIEARDLRYLPVGAGSYHWAADDRWFVTVDGLGFAETFEPLRRALRTAVALPLDFVVAPIDRPQVLWPIGERHTVSVFPLLDGESGDFGPHTGTREAVIDLVAALHRATPAVAGVTEVTDLRLPGRAGLLAGLDRPWDGGPYAEPARAVLTGHAAKIRSWLDDYDRMAATLRGGSADWVVTHGEPHPGNVLRTAAGLRLVDWDTARIAPPERDLWHLAADPFAPRVADLARYTTATGREPSATGLAFYRLSWILADIAGYADTLRRPHGTGGDAEDALTYLRINAAMP